MNIEEDVIETLNKTIKFYEDLDILYNSKEPCSEIRAVRWIITAYEKEKEKNKKAIDFINERKKTVSKDMAKETRLQVGTFMWQVNELLEILKGVEEE